MKTNHDTENTERATRGTEVTEGRKTPLINTQFAIHSLK